VIASGLAVLLWSQTVIDQVAGWGNLRAALSSPGDASGPGLGGGLRIVADVVVAARGYVRPGYGSWEPDRGIAGTFRVALLLLVILALVGGAAYAMRAGRRSAASGLVVAVVALCASVIDAANLPLLGFGERGLSPANFRWLWSTTTLLMIGGFLAVGRYTTATDLRGKLFTAVTWAVLMVAVVANVPSSQQVARPELYREQLRLTAEMTEQLRDVELSGPVVVDQSNLYFGHPFGYPAAVVLQDRGIEYRFEGAMQARRFGETRVADGSEPERLVMWRGDEARARVDAPNRVVHVAGDDPLVVLLEEGP
jgi:hypothetical protein